MFFSIYLELIRIFDLINYLNLFSNHLYISNNHEYFVVMFVAMILFVLFAIESN